MNSKNDDCKFSQLGIGSNIIRAIGELGYKDPTAIQQRSIPFLLKSDSDFIGQAQTGTGKTAAFVIPLLEKLDFSLSHVQAIVLAPTRELAFQIESEIKKLGIHTPVKSTCVYGGTSYDSQIQTLRKEKPQIVVGTPGRVIDLIKKKILKLDQAKLCILDEADEMLNMGFFDDVQTILDAIRPAGRKLKVQLIMFSATMPAQIIKLIKKSFSDPEIVKIEKETLSNEDIEQKYFVVKEKHFKEALARLIDSATDVYGIVFCRTKLETKSVGDDLKNRGYLVEVLNGDMGQVERDHAMSNFRKGKVRILVCTDVAARGIDVDNLSHVFNYGLTRDIESYVHRIGRTGRAGMKGKAYTIIGASQVFSLQQIEKHINKKIEYSKLPSINELKRKVVASEIEGARDILSAIKHKGDDFKTEDSYELFENEFKTLEKEELLKMFFVWKFNKKMRRYNNLVDIEQMPSKGEAVNTVARSIRRRKGEKFQKNNLKENYGSKNAKRSRI